MNRPCATINSPFVKGRYNRFLIPRLIPTPTVHIPRRNYRVLLKFANREATFVNLVIGDCRYCTIYSRIFSGPADSHYLVPPTLGFLSRT